MTTANAPAAHTVHTALDAHFRSVIATLRRRTPRNVRGAAARARSDCVDRLDEYRQRGLFPRNRRFPGRRVPHFIDAAGARCAMAHLMEREAPEVVQHVAAQRNYARMHRLSDIPEVAAWLERNGLTVDEAALIQPAYPADPVDVCVCTHRSPTLLVGYVAQDGKSMVVTATYFEPHEAAVVELVNPDVDLSPGELVVARVDDDRQAEFLARLDGPMLELANKSCQDGMGAAHAPADLSLELFVAATYADTRDECADIITNCAAGWSPDDKEADWCPTVVSPKPNLITPSSSGCSASGLPEPADAGGWPLLLAVLALGVARKRCRSAHARS